MTNQPKWQKAKVIDDRNFLLPKGSFIWVDSYRGLHLEGLTFNHDEDNRCKFTDCRGYLEINIIDVWNHSKIHQFRVELLNKYRREVPIFHADIIREDPNMNNLPSDEEELEQQKA